MPEHHRAELVVDALKISVGRRGLEKGCIANRTVGRSFSHANTVVW